MKLKIFTVEEANRLIPILEALLRDFQQKRKRMEESALRGETKQKRESLPVETLQAIEQMGCVLRDPFQGLVDFPAIREKNSIYLCWKLGERRIGFYHGVDDGFRGRKPLK